MLPGRTKHSNFQVPEDSSRDSMVKSFDLKWNIFNIICVSLDPHHFTNPYERRRMNEDVVLNIRICRALMFI